MLWWNILLTTQKFLIINRPIKGFILFDDINHEAYDIGECSNKTVIEVCKPYKHLDILNAGRGFLVFNNFNFFRIHADAFNRNDQF